MTIFTYLICFSCIPILYLISRRIKRHDQFFCLFAGLMFFLLIINTPVEIRADYDIYSGGYKYISRLSLKGLCDGFHLIKHFDLPWPYRFESGFVVFQWISSHIGLDYFMWTVVYAAICSAVSAKFVFKYSSNVYVSYLIWMAFYFYSIVGRFRQSIALMLFMMSLKYVKDKKLWKFLLMVVIAFLFHQSSIVFLPVYFMQRIPLSKKQYLKFLILIPVVSLALGWILLPKIISAFGYSAAKHSISFRVNNRLLLILAFCILAFFITDFSKMKDNPEKRLVYWGSLLSLGLSVVGAFEDVVSRAVEYYFIFPLLLIPDLLQSFRRKTRFLANGLLFLSLLAFFYFDINGSILIQT